MDELNLLISNDVQKQVIECFNQGMTTKEIASKLNLRENLVKDYLSKKNNNNKQVHEKKQKLLRR